MKNCSNCGIAIKHDEDSLDCFKFGKKNASIVDTEKCDYYTKVIYEDGEAMTPLQHLLLKEQELKSRKMKGVI
ncbi:MAG: hypothetical protein N2645_19935 [Clostridia bacterium]|nr:hypothetical protein [Clostridia bacterium]